MNFETYVAAVKAGKSIDLYGALAAFALQYEGTVEDGENRGRLIEAFQRRVKLEPGSAYCLAFCFFAIDGVGPLMAKVTRLHRTGLVWDVWHRSPPGCRKTSPRVGYVSCWNIPHSTR